MHVEHVKREAELADKILACGVPSNKAVEQAIRAHLVCGGSKSKCPYLESMRRDVIELPVLVAPLILAKGFTVLEPNAGTTFRIAPHACKSCGGS